jgi:hypothetical protein
MDWEKQDNEIRRLMEGAGFLPDAEIWDESLTWKRLQRKRQGAKRRYPPVIVRLAAAACVAGLLGMGLWILIKSSPFIESEANTFKKIVVKSSAIKEKPEPSSKKDIDGNLRMETNATLAVTGSSAPGKTLIIKEKNSPKEPDDLMVVQTGQSFDAGKTGNPEIPVENSGAVAGVKIEPATTSISPKTEPQSTGTVPAKVVGLRVVHYNMLNGNTGTPPPVFVKTRKPEPEWEYVAGRATEASTFPSPQLIIDISPTPKKSL